ncbi:hypothetical protein G6F31_014260 [Rhizopus arrhizus]|nr:hypothetical protein G6F31_014260 [Rhizopus arrhizus]
MPCRREQHRDFLAHFLQQRQHFGDGGALRAVVHQHVEQGELDLAHGLHAALVVAGSHQAVVERARQGFARVHMGRQLLHHRPFPAEVLHELARQFHRIPLHAIDAGHAQFTDAGQQLVQSVAHLMEQRGHFVVAEGGRLAVGTTAEVAYQIDQRRLHAAIGALAAVAAIIHPRTATLALARIQVQVELADQRALRIDQAEEAHILMPHRRAVFLHAQAIQLLDHREQAAQYLRFGEVLLHVLLGIAVARLLQAIGGERQVPGLQAVDAQLFSRELLQLGAILGRERLGTRGQVTQETQHFGRVLRHLGRHRIIAIRTEAEQRGQLRTQGQDAVDVAAVVQRVVAEFGRALRTGPVQDLAQGTGFGPGLHRQVARHLQGRPGALHPR